MLVVVVGGVLGNYLIYKCGLQNAQSCLFISVWECECPSCVGAFRRYDTIECNANELKVNKNKSRKKQQNMEQTVGTFWIHWMDGTPHTDSLARVWQLSNLSPVPSRWEVQNNCYWNSIQNKYNNFRNNNNTNNSGNLWWHVL